MKEFKVETSQFVLQSEVIDLPETFIDLNTDLAKYLKDFLCKNLHKEEGNILMLHSETIEGGNILVYNCWVREDKANFSESPQYKIELDFESMLLYIVPVVVSEYMQPSRVSKYMLGK